jgi:hypothetical protein
MVVDETFKTVMYSPCLPDILMWSKFVCAARHRGSANKTDATIRVFIILTLS